MARPARVERATLCLEGRCSIQLSYGRNQFTLPVWRSARKRGCLVAGWRGGGSTVSRSLDFPGLAWLSSRSLGPSMYIAIQLLIFWALAFLTLCVALVLLNIFYGLIGDGLELLSSGKEAVIAGIASLIEAAGVWLVVLFIPAAYRWLGLRALIIPVIIVALIYKVAHLEDWSRFEIFLLLIFQIVISCLGVSLFFGHFQTAMIILLAFATVLAVIAGFARSL